MPKPEPVKASELKHVLFNTGKREYPLTIGEDGKERVLRPGKSLKLTVQEFDRLKRYPELMDPAKVSPEAAELQEKLLAENKTLRAQVKELTEQVAELTKPDTKKTDKPGK